MSDTASRSGSLANGAPLTKINRLTAEICARFPLSDEARSLLDAALSPAAFLDRLCDGALCVDAIRFLAHALPSREAVWWACLVARDALVEAPTGDLRAIEAAEDWVYHPDEEHRRTAMAAVDPADNNSPARWAATGAAWSGGSLAPPDAPIVPPGETLTAQAVSGAVLLAAVKSEPERAAERHRNAIAQAVDIARGGTGRKHSAD